MNYDEEEVLDGSILGEEKFDDSLDGESFSEGNDNFRFDEEESENS